MRAIARAVLAALVAGAVACGDGIAPPQTSTLIASLATPAGKEGAVLLDITGPAIANVQAATSSYRVFWRLNSSTEAHVIVAGDLVPGPLFTLDGSAAGNQVSAYAVEILQVADRTDSLRTDLSGYRVTLSNGAAQ